MPDAMSDESRARPVPPLEEIRTYWDADAPTYNNSRGHSARSPAVLAAWTASLARLLPQVPGRCSMRAREPGS